MRALRSLLKPQYVYRPAQLLRRLGGTRPRTGRLTVRLPWGLDIEVDVGEAIGRAIWRLGVYELALSEALWRTLDPGDTAIDVGANIGHMTGLMAVRVGPGGRVLAFEPHPRVYEELRRNVLLCSRDSRTGEIQTFPLALDEASGDAFLSPGEHFAGNHGLARLTRSRQAAIPVAATTLDDVLGAGRAAVVKIDVEGCELAVLRGGRRALREGRIRTLLYESQAGGKGAVEELLSDLGYAVFGLGMRFRGLVLSPPGKRPAMPEYEPLNYLATREPAALLPRLQSKGWRLLAPWQRQV